MPKPSNNLNIKIGHPSSISLYDLRTQLTHENFLPEKKMNFTR